MNSTKHKIIFRADGNSVIGLGHVVRSLALAELLKDTFDCIFVSYNLNEMLEESVLKVCKELIPLNDECLESFTSYLRGNEIVVLDGYNFKTDFQAAVKNKGCMVVSIDDIHGCHFLSDVIVNHGMCISVEDYSNEAYTRLFLGTEYLLLRTNFYNAMLLPRKIECVENLFINLGGSDPLNITMKLLESINVDSFKNIHVIIGATNTSYHSIQRLVSGIKNVRLHFNLDQFDMEAIMHECQIGISTPSGIAYELSAVGIGLIVCNTTSNQDHFYKFFTEYGLAAGVNVNDLNYIEKIVAMIEEMRLDLDLIAGHIKSQRNFFRYEAKENVVNIFKSLKN